MLTISSIPEALAELEIRTGRAWTDSEIFDLATNCDIELHAAPPITARITIQKFIVGEGLVEKFRSPPGHALLAVLFPWQVAQLWMSGETKTSHPSKHDEMEGEYQWFTEPVRITREQVRIKAGTLQKMFAVWSQAQAGRWIEDTTKPGGMRYQHCPEWMFPAEEFVPAQTAATPAPVEAVSASDDIQPDKAGPAKPLQRTAAQDSAILCEIEKQGYDPLALPKNLPGKPGVKAAIRAALSENSLFTGGTVFDKAWERLTAHADIAIQD